MKRNMILLRGITIGILLLVMLVSLFISPVTAGKYEINGTVFYPLYNGSYSKTHIEKMDYNFTTGDFYMSFDSGKLRLLNWTGGWPNDYILNPETNQPVSMWSGWKAESYRTSGQGSWIEMTPLTHRFVVIDEKTLMRSMTTISGGSLNITYKLQDGKLKFIVNRTAGTENRAQRVRYEMDFVNGQGTLLNSSKRFNPGFNYTINTLWDYNDIPSPASFGRIWNKTSQQWEGTNSTWLEGYNISQEITQGGTRYNFIVDLNGSQVMPSGRSDEFDPSWQTNGTTSPIWQNTSWKINIPELIQYNQTSSWDSIPTPWIKTVDGVNVRKGDTVVIYTIGQDYNSPGWTDISISDNTSLTWTIVQNFSSASYTLVKMWVNESVPSDRVIKVNATYLGTGEYKEHGINVVTFRKSLGVGNSTKTSSSSGAPSLGITTTFPNSSIIMAIGDWNAAGGTRTKRMLTGSSNVTQVSYLPGDAMYNAIGVYYNFTDGIGLKTVGESAPTGQKYGIEAVEIKGYFTNQTAFYDTSNANTTYQVDTNLTIDSGANYSVYYAGSVIGTPNATGNQSISFTGDVNTSISIICYSNATGICRPLGITFYSQAEGADSSSFQMFNGSIVQESNITEQTKLSNTAQFIPIGNLSGLSTDGVGYYNVSYQVDQQYSINITWLLYKNNVSIGANHYSESSSYVGFYDVLYGTINSTDLFTIYGKGNGGNNNLSAKNINISYNVTPSILLPLNNSNQSFRGLNITTNIPTIYNGTNVQISNVSDFSSSVYNSTINASYLSINLSKGTYYIRVASLGNLSQDISNTNWSNSTIVRIGYIVGSNYGSYIYDETFESTRILNMWNGVTVARESASLILSEELNNYTHRYKMDSTVYDSNLSNPVDGVTYNSTWGTGLYGNAWIGNGYSEGDPSSSYFYLGKENITGKNFTLFARVKPVSCLNGANEIISKLSWGLPNSVNSYLFDLDDSCHGRIATSDDGTNWDEVVDTGVAIPTGSWTNMTVIGNGTNTKIYYENELKGTGAITGNVWDSDVGVAIGRVADHSSLAFNGSIDDVQIWNNYGVSPQDIPKLINNTHLTAGYFNYSHEFSEGEQGYSVVVTFDTPPSANNYYDIYAGSSIAESTLLASNVSSGTEYVISGPKRSRTQAIMVVLNSLSNISLNNPIANITIVSEQSNYFSATYTTYPTNLSLNHSINVSVLSDGSNNPLLFRFRTNIANYYEIPYLLNQSGIQNITLSFSSARITGSPSWSNITSIAVSSVSSNDSISVSDLVINPTPISESLQDRFHIDYYSWYSADVDLNWYSHWDSEGHVPPNDLGMNLAPLNAPYDSRLNSTIDRHFKWIKSAGINVITYEWWEWSDDTYLVNTQLGQAFDIAEQNNLKVILFYDSSSDYASPQNFVNRVQTYMNTYRNRTGLYRDIEYNNRPIVYLYWTNLRGTPSEWSENLSILRGTNNDVVVLGHNINTSFLNEAGFDGTFTYENYNYNAETASFAVREKSQKKMFSSAISPGVDRTRCCNATDYPNIYYRNRENGTYYLNYFNNATYRDSSERFNIVSFNELLEGTGIEPADPDMISNETIPYNYDDYTPHPPTYYLDKTAQMISNYSGLGQRPLLDYYGNNLTNNYSIRFNTSSNAASFNVTSNRTANIRWYVNNILVLNDTDVSADVVSYLNTSLSYGLNIIEVNASNSNGTTATLYWTVTVDEPPASISNSNTTTGNFWILNQWTNPISDFDHIEVRNITTDALLTNLSNTSWNRTLSPHYTQNISMQTVDSSGNVNQTKVWFNTTIPNNIPILTSIGSKTVVQEELLSFSLSGSDGDSDSIACSSNESVSGSLTGCDFSWTPNSSESGLYDIRFYYNDSYGGSDYEDVSINVTSIPTSIIYVIPTPENGSINRTGNIGINVSTSNIQSVSLDWNNTLSLWLRFNESSGATTIEDSSGYHNNGTASGSYISSVGKYGLGGKFDGTNDNVTIPVSSSLNLTKNYTISGWLKPNTTGTNGYILVKNQASSGDIEYAVHRNSAAKNLNFYVNGVLELALVNDTCPDNVWTHFTFIQNGTHLLAYINGTLNTTVSYSTAIVPTSQSLLIGNRKVNSLFYNGYMDDIRIYKRVLTVNEIQSMYNLSAYSLNITMNNLSTGSAHNATAYGEASTGVIYSTEKRFWSVDLADYSNPALPGSLGCTQSILSVVCTWVGDL